MTQPPYQGPQDWPGQYGQPGPQDARPGVPPVPPPPPAQPPQAPQYPPNQPAQYGAPYGSYGQQPSPYGTYPPPPPAPSGGRRTPLIIAAAVAAVAVIGGVVWFATSGGGDDDKPSANGSSQVSVKPSTGAPESEEPAVEPSATPSEEETGIGAEPTGTGMVGMWRSDSGGGMLGLKESVDTEKPDKISVILVSGGLECRGIRKVAEPEKKYQIAVLCERGGKPVKAEDRAGDLTYGGGDSVTVSWFKGKSGTETFTRYGDWPES